MRYSTHREVLEGLKPLNRVAYLRYMRAINDKKLPKWPFPEGGHKCLSAGLICSFPLHQSVEGYEFWTELYNAIYALENETISVA